MEDDAVQSARTAAPASAEEADDALMARFDIVRISADQFHVDGYRYTHLAEALAQARRSRRPDA
jgi:hypothetical protein